MAKKSERVLDVWITETQAVYTEVPFSVVADWVQQGRLLADDRVRLAGNQTWHLLRKVPAFASYLPQAEPLDAPASPSDALEPIDLGWRWRHPEESEDDDVDMIPLIDISLVLLIFFMMTATISSGIFSPIRPPETKYPSGVLAADQFWIGVDGKNPAGLEQRDAEGMPLPWFSLGRDKEEITPPTVEFHDVLGSLTRQLVSAGGEVKVRLKADRELPIEVVTGLMRQVQELQARLNRERGNTGRLSLTILGEVSEGGR